MKDLTLPAAGLDEAHLGENSLEYGEPATADIAARFLDMASEAFMGDWRAEFDRSHWRRIRTLTIGGEVASGVILHPLGQWFGGRRVGSYALAAAVTASQYRRRKIGRALMLYLFREAAENCVPLSVLYTTAPEYYRQLGYEAAGQRCIFNADMHELADKPQDAHISPISSKEDGVVYRVYQEFAACRSGCLDRDGFFWRRILGSGDDVRRYLYGIEFGDGCEGYICFARRREESVLLVRDVVCLTQRAARAALAFLSKYSSAARSVLFSDGPRGPLHQLMSANCLRPRLRSCEQWMLRITDVSAALLERGYPNIDLELHLAIDDPSFPENIGRYILSLSGGKPSVSSGGSGSVKLDVRALAAIYTGHCHPREMQDAGLLGGPQAEIDRLGVAFAGPRPFMLDSF